MTVAPPDDLAPGQPAPGQPAPGQPTPGASPRALSESIPPAERKLVFLLAAVQFVNILDFMMVMPLGPDFATALGIPTSRLGIIGGSYTAAAAIAGLIGQRFLDRFDRRRALTLAMLGLVVGTLSGAFAKDFLGLVVTRIIAGVFGGPATSIALATLSDAVPPQRRGRAMGAVMGAFSAASVLGVPAGLELAHQGDWRTPFFAVAGMGLLVVLAAFVVMAPQRAHLDRNASAPPRRSLLSFVSTPLVRLSFLATTSAFLGVFAIVPNLATYFQYNLGFPRAQLAGLYFYGGIMTFFTMRIAGAVVDRKGSLPAIWFGAGLMALLCTVGFIPEHSLIPVPALFIGFMLANSTRMVGLNTLTSKVPAPQDRARFMSIQNAVQHIAGAIGAVISSAVLVERPDHGLYGMDRVAILVLVLALALPLLVRQLARRL